MEDILAKQLPESGRETVCSSPSRMQIRIEQVQCLIGDTWLCPTDRETREKQIKEAERLFGAIKSRVSRMRFLRKIIVPFCEKGPPWRG